MSQDSGPRRIVLVTGGSRGIGAATARLAARRGYDVAVNYVTNEEAAAQVVRDAEIAGARAIAVQADVSSEGQVCRMFEEVDRRLGTVAALVNNAAVLNRQMPVREMSGDRINRILAVNVTGVFLCAREAVRRMSTARGGNGGAIVNISSGAVAQEVARDGIRVNAVRPGFIYTEMHASGGEPGRVDRVKASVPMQRGGYPEEVARAILWLLSDEASFSTGTFIDVSGGR
jgi:NAD(P)-dependent dehydrogenase (short-subunit alcohol dehydrogenase family)